jgi:hypothetical protein
MSVREEVEAELQRRVRDHEPLSTILSWLQSTGTPIDDATEMLEGLQLTRKDAELLIRAHPDWNPR